MINKQANADDLLTISKTIFEELGRMLTKQNPKRLQTTKELIESPILKALEEAVELDISITDSSLKSTLSSYDLDIMRASIYCRDLNDYSKKEIQLLRNLDYAIYVLVSQCSIPTGSCVETYYKNLLENNSVIVKILKVCELYNDLQHDTKSSESYINHIEVIQSLCQTFPCDLKKFIFKKFPEFQPMDIAWSVEV